MKDVFIVIQLNEYNHKLYCTNLHYIVFKRDNKPSTFLVMTIGSTKPELHVDIWAGNHPFFTGSQKIIDTEGRVERFMRKYKMEENE